MPVTTQSISAVLATYLRQGFAAALLSTLIVGVAQARTLDAALAAGITPLGAVTTRGGDNVAESTWKPIWAMTGPPL